MTPEFQEIIEKIELLLNGYSSEFRATIQPQRFSHYHTIHPDYKYHPEDDIVRESLLEHVGTLPILASFFHPYVDQKINLWRVLEMLAIHDIWEIVTWDKIVFLKNKNDDEAETKVALELLHESQHAIYMEYLKQKTPESHFAKSVDKISPDIYDFICDTGATIYRLKHFANIHRTQTWLM